jgi:hypothetical protein
MNHFQVLAEAAGASPTVAPPTRACVQPQARSRPPGEDSQRLYQVSLTAADLQLIQACSNWIGRLGPAPDIRARLDHLDQLLAGARPAR